MHIEGPPRVDRPARALRRRRRAPEVVVRGESRGGLAAWCLGGADRDRPRTRLRPHHRAGPGDPAAARRAALARAAALRLALAQGLHRRGAGRLLGGAAAGRRARVGDGRRVALAVREGADILRIHDRSSLQAVRVARRIAAMRATASMASRALLETPWAIAIDPARRDGRIVAESSEAERAARPVALPRVARPRPGRGAGRAGIERLYSHQRDALRRPPPPTW